MRIDKCVKKIYFAQVQTLIMNRTLILIAGVLWITYSCSNENGNSSGADDAKNVKQVETDIDTLSDDAEVLVDALFSNIPSPITLSFVLRDAGIQFVDALPHDPEKVTNYIDRKGMAINLGIYGTDLTYSNIMDHSEEAIRYMAACVHLHEELGIEEAVGTDLIVRMEKNRDNKDSMRAIVSESLASLEAYLKESGQLDVAGMMLAGSTVEALFISTQVVDLNNPDPKIAQLIADQKYSVKSLKELFEAYSKEEGLSDYLTDINRIWEVYEKMPEEKMSGENKMEGEVLVIGSKQQIKATPEHLAALKEVVTELRSRYITH